MARTRWTPARHDGFTLIELLVVIGAVAVILALFLPTLLGARAQAARVACASKLRQVFAAIQMYEADFGMMPPGFKRDASFEPIGLHVINGCEVTDQGLGLLVPRPVGWGRPPAYLPDPNLLFCPADIFSAENRDAVRWAPSVPGGGGNYMSYTYLFVDAQGTRGTPGSPDPQWAALRRDQLALPGSRAILRDCGEPRPVGDPNAHGNAFYHKGAWNVLYTDGGVSTVLRANVEPLVDTSSSQTRTLSFIKALDSAPR